MKQEIPAIEVASILSSDRSYDVCKHGADALFAVNMRQLSILIRNDAVSAMVRFKRKRFDGISYFRLLCPEHRARQLAGIGKGSKHGEHFSAEDDKTCIRDGRSYRHHRSRSDSYGNSCIGARMPEKATA